MHRRTQLLADQSNAGDDVAPLVGPADLQRAAVPLVQFDVVVGLQEHVAELGVGDAFAVEAPANRVPVEHDVDGEVFADVAQEFDGRELRGPGDVVFDDRARRRAVEVDESLELTPDPVGPLRHGVRGVEVAFTRVARIPDHARGAAREHDRPVPGALESP